jgi:hypothetical protein
MSISINSQEFAAAWRLVSETLLAHIQGGGTIVLDSNSSDNTAGVVNNAPQYVVPITHPTDNKQVNDIRYAACPVRQADGSYTLKNLKEERQSESTFKITRYTDGSCEFELCDLQGEARQIFKDNKADRLPSAVGTVSGEITSDNKIHNVKPGKGVVDGRSVKITEPLVVEFK